jgi:DNA polymerase I-like protein with 3'-5' exonuclease and polymerase domains
LIQGSAADQTKEAMIYINDHLEGDERIVNTVHDEISVSHPPERTEDIRRIFHEAANALPCDVPMRMDVRTGNNFAEASKE